MASGTMISVRVIITSSAGSPPVFPIKSARGPGWHAGRIHAAPLPADFSARSKLSTMTSALSREIIK